MTMAFEGWTYDQCSEYYKKLEKLIDEIDESKKPIQATLKELDDLLMMRLHTDGVTAVATPHGTIHTIGRTTARVMDPQAFREFVKERDAWDMLDLKANMTACRGYMEKRKEHVPGVELSTTRRLSITAPRPAKRKTDDVE